jgi:hypothetical protein
MASWAAAGEEEGEEPKQVEQQSDHLAEIVAGFGPTDQPLGRRRVLGRVAREGEWAPIQTL